MPSDPPRQLGVEQFTVLPVHLDHALRVGELPPHHSDPFDRMLVAQAQVDDLLILSGDRILARYDIPVIDATP